MGQPSLPFGRCRGWVRGGWMAWRTHRSVPRARSLSPPRTGRVHRRHAALLNPACPTGRPHGRTAARGSTRCPRSPQGESGLTLTSHPAARRGLLHSLVGSTRLRILVVAIVVCAAGATVASVRTLALFTSTGQTPASFSAGRIFPASARPRGSSSMTRPVVVPRSTARARSPSWATVARPRRRPGRRRSPPIATSSSTSTRRCRRRSAPRASRSGSRSRARARPERRAGM